MPLEYDAIHWEEDGNGDYMPLETPLDINYPAENVVYLGTVYGYSDQYTGSMGGAGPRPTTPKVRIQNNLDYTATATVTGSDSNATNTIWIFLRHGGVLELINAGSRVGDGVVGISKTEGEYIGYCISEYDGVLSLPSNPDGFWVTQDRQYQIRTSAAQAELQIARLSQFGVQAIFQNGNTADPITVWCTMSGGGETLTLRDSVRTNTETLELHVPRQTSFPPEEFRPGATFTIEDRVYEIDTVSSSNAILERSSSFAFTCGNYRWLNRLDATPAVVTGDDDYIEAKIV